MVPSRNIDVVVATFGDERWRVLAETAAESVRRQTVPCGLQVIHGRTLAEARNLGAERAAAPYLLFLDADDVLRPDFVEKMSSAVEPGNDQILLQSQVSFSNAGRAPEAPKFLRARPILSANYLIVGTGVARSTFLRVGGFRELDLFEDWDLWIRCFADGCLVRRVPGAVYEVRLSPGSRNDAGIRRMSTMAQKLRQQYFPAIYGRPYNPLSAVHLLREEVSLAISRLKS
jgi:glycosyltransferase involved in cell wall biosynthesis